MVHDVAMCRKPDSPADVRLSRAQMILKMRQWESSAESDSMKSAKRPGKSSFRNALPAEDALTIHHRVTAPAMERRRSAPDKMLDRLVRMYRIDRGFPIACRVRFVGKTRAHRHLKKIRNNA